VRRIEKESEPVASLEKPARRNAKAHVEAEQALRERELTPEERKGDWRVFVLSARPVLSAEKTGDDESRQAGPGVSGAN